MRHSDILGKPPSMDESALVRRFQDLGGRDPPIPLTEVIEGSLNGVLRWHPRSLIIGPVGEEVKDSDPDRFDRIRQPVPEKEQLPELDETSNAESGDPAPGPECVTPPDSPRYPSDEEDEEQDSSDGEEDSITQGSGAAPADNGGRFADLPSEGGFSESVNSPASTSDDIEAPLRGGSPSLEDEAAASNRWDSLPLKRKLSGDDTGSP
jgi:hypothetical protein